MILDLEGTDGIDVIAKEINTIGVFATKGIDIENGATKGILTWLVDIIDLTEAEFMEGLLDLLDGYGLILLEGELAGIETLLGNHHLGQGLRIGHDIEVRGER